MTNFDLYSQSDSVLSIFFPTAQYQVAAKDVESLQTFFEARHIRVKQISGYADTVGSVRSNLTLSLARAKAVQRLIQQMTPSATEPQLRYVGEVKSKGDDLSHSRRVDILYEILPTELSQHKTGSDTIQGALPKEKVDSAELPVAPPQGETDSAALPVVVPEYEADSARLLSTTDFPNDRDNRILPSDSVNGLVTGEVVTLRPIKKLQFQNILFIPDKPILEQSSFAVVDKLAAELKKYPAAYFEIRGHVNLPKYFRGQNDTIYLGQMQALSFNRAKEIFEMLAERGISRDRMRYRGMGNTNMLFPNPRNEAEMRKNMRVEVIVYRR
jgi:outer membrane protein OmpA-like peptidoglycan-associated protein